MIDKKIGMIGAGNMGSALVASLVVTGEIPGDRILVSDVDQNRCENLKKEFGVFVSDNEDLVSTSDIIIFAVKPQNMDELLRALSEKKVFIKKKNPALFVSIAAGIRLNFLEKRIYADCEEKKRQKMPIFRVMPNTPAMVGAGVAGICANSYATDSDKAVVERLFSVTGKTFFCNEDMMDSVTALTGSGPAYFFYFMEALVEAAIKLGFDKESAIELVLATGRGALKLMAERKIRPDQLRKQVTSPGGTTEAAISVMEKKGLTDTVIKALTAARNRSIELSNLFK